MSVSQVNSHKLSQLQTTQLKAEKIQRAIYKSFSKKLSLKEVLLTENSLTAKFSKNYCNEKVYNGNSY